MIKQKTASDFLLFLRSWAARPLEVAAIAPSSRRLAMAMTTEIGPFSGNVLELGPGTGAFTRALLRKGVYENNLILVERNPAFATLLRKRYPSATLIEGDAQHLSLPAVKSVGAAISGLPLLSMPAQAVQAILSAIFHHLAEGASLFQFTYGPRCPISPQILAGLGLEASFQRWVPLNLPAASVYRISRSPA
ncbi:class I SAM-dependent methyltransferase [Ensifer sp. 2YAB10]|uniref:class I SAM-dependent methyltransferase n=1 Tax=unclassified Ensifer TaxID=2633371 RepID=UPI003F8FB166